MGTAPHRTSRIYFGCGVLVAAVGAAVDADAAGYFISFGACPNAMKNVAPPRGLAQLLCALEIW
jgi:hypothetical protein